jgi:hypothetical protein
MLETIHAAQALRICPMSAALGHAALKTGSDCSFTARKFRVLAAFRLA